MPATDTESQAKIFKEMKFYGALCRRVFYGENRGDPSQAFSPRYYESIFLSSQRKYCNEANFEASTTLFQGMLKPQSLPRLQR